MPHTTAEMQLEDGRFLMSPTRYDSLLKSTTAEALAAYGVVRVSDRFATLLALVVFAVFGVTGGPLNSCMLDCLPVIGTLFSSFLKVHLLSISVSLKPV